MLPFQQASSYILVAETKGVSLTATCCCLCSRRFGCLEPIASDQSATGSHFMIPWQSTGSRWRVSLWEFHHPKSPQNAGTILASVHVTSVSGQILVSMDWSCRENLHNHRFSRLLWGFPVSVFPYTNPLIVRTSLCHKRLSPKTSPRETGATGCPLKVCLPSWTKRNWPLTKTRYQWIWYNGC